MKTWHKAGLLAGIFVLAAVLPAAANGLDAVKSRMIQRVGAVKALLATQAAGENNRGLLEARGRLSKEQGAVLAAENADRTQVYAAIAAKAGTDTETVGRQRAASIAQKAAGGTLVQGADGKWAAK